MIGYYYCSLETFLNIVKNKQIYLSDPLKMNDSMELKWYLDILNKDNQNNNGLIESVFSKMKKQLQLDFTYEKFVDILNTRGQRIIYISCFSENKDALSQWRAYANDGNGVSIGFDLDQMAEEDNLFVEKIIYSKKINPNNTNKSVELISTAIRRLLNKYKIFDEDNQIAILLYALIPVLASYKNPAFAEEKEVRLIYSNLRLISKIITICKESKKDFVFKELDHDFRIVNNSDITEYVKLDFDSNAITEICIGPKCHLNANDVLNISKRYLGTKPKVTVSKASYR